MHSILKAATGLLIVVTAGCSQPQPPQAETPEYQGREETRALQNADNIGYDGTGIQKKLDGALDKNDQRAADLDAQIDAQTGAAKADVEQ